MKLILKRRIRTSTIPPDGNVRLALPGLSGIDLSFIVLKTNDGKPHKITAVANKRNAFDISLKNQPINQIITLSFYKTENAVEKLSEDKPIKSKVLKLEPLKNKVVEKLKETQKKSKKKWTGYFNFLQKKQKDRRELNQEKIEAIRDKNLSLSGLNGQTILTLDFTGCWARGLGQIQKAIQLEHELKLPLHQYFNRVAGMGDGAIIAAAVAAGIPLKDLADWWITEWRKVHSPGIFKKIGRATVSMFKPAQSGYDAKQARAALRKLFTKTSVDLRMKDVLTELQITVIQADMKVSVHYSPDNPEMELFTAVEDSAVTKIHYNQKETIKGEAVFLGAIEKNDVMGLVLSDLNKNMQICSIGAAVRINPARSIKLGKLGHAADKVALQAATHFVYEKRIKQLIKKLSESGYKINYSRLECSPIDGVVSNDTSEAAMKAGIESGSGQNNLLKEKHERIS